MAKKSVTIEEFKSWIGNIGKFSRSPRNIVVITDGGNGYGNDVWEHCYTVCFYTDNNCYHITACDSNDSSYLGCSSSRRKPRAGEDRTRGSDLADGPLTKKTWHKILGDIVSYEMVDLSMSSSKGVPDLPTVEENCCDDPSLGEDDITEADEPIGHSS